MFNKNRFKNWNLDKIIFESKFIMFVISLLSFIGFPVVYNFLFGYFFGGPESNLFSVFQSYSNLVPFDLKLFSATTIFFLGIYYIVSTFIITVFRNRGISNKYVIKFFITAILMSVLFTLLFSLFFAGEITLIVLLSFFGLYVSIILTIILCASILYTVFCANQTFVVQVLIHFIYGWYILLNYFQIEKTVLIIAAISLVLLTLFISIINQMLNNQNLKLFFVYTLNFSSFCLFYFIIVNDYTLTRFSIFYTILLCIFTYKLKLVDQLNKTISSKEAGFFLHDNTYEDIIKKIELMGVQAHKRGLIFNVFVYFYRLIESKNNELYKMFISLFLLSSFLLAPQLSFLFGNSVRHLNSMEDKWNIRIEYFDNRNSINCLNVNYYIIQDNEVIFSDENWNLGRLKNDNYKIVNTENGSGFNSCVKLDVK